ncbi:MAG TPA: hypothetical protein H9837_02780 [Candidatus Brachybacterium merdigallinarum]|nr:hypothetical protein [Candidatus Brachybacterium merdigallinarum]
MHPRDAWSRRSAPAASSALTRRRLLAGTGVLGAGAALLSACGSSSSTGSGTVTLWDLFSGADGANMRTMVADVEAAHPELSADITTLAWGNPYYTKLAMAASSQSPPDTAIMHVSRMPGFAPGGLLEPWDLDRLAQVGLTQDSFTEAQ